MVTGQSYTPLTMREIVDVLKTEDLCILGTTDGNTIEMGPMWFVFDYIKGSFIFYFISVKDGEKVENMKYNGIAGIELDQQAKDIMKTIVINGAAKIVRNYKEQEYIVEKFIKKYYNRPCILDEFKCSPLQFVRVDVQQITGRQYPIC